MKPETVPLGEACVVVMGQSPPGTSYNTSGDGLPFFQGKTDFGDMHPKVRVFCNQPARIAEDGDILMSVRAPVGPTNLAKGKCCIGRGLAALRPGNKLETSFLLYFLRHHEPRLASQGQGSTFDAINRDDLEQIEVPLPDLSEQQRVARRLEQADRLRHIRRYALELTDGFLTATFLKLFGDPIKNPLRLPVAELGDFLSFVTSGSRGWAEHYVSEGARFIRSLDVRMNNISDENAVFVDPPHGAEADRTRVKPGDVLLTITGSRIGRVAPVPERLNNAYISQHVAILRLKAGLLAEFVSMFLSLDTGGQRQIARVQYGQTKPGLNLDQIRGFRIPVPPPGRQEQFLEQAKRVERLRAVQREAVRQAEHLFASLLHRAFSS